MHHPLEDDGDDLPIIYAMCVVWKRLAVPSRGEITRAGMRAGVEVMGLGSSDRVAIGFDAYRQLIDDLESHHGPEELPSDEARRFLPWLGLGILHHHGSRWAIRDFLDEVLSRGDFVGRERSAVAEAHELYADITCSHQSASTCDPSRVRKRQGESVRSYGPGWHPIRRERGSRWRIGLLRFRPRLRRHPGLPPR